MHFLFNRCIFCAINSFSKEAELYVLKTENGTFANDFSVVRRLYNSLINQEPSNYLHFKIVNPIQYIDEFRRLL